MTGHILFAPTLVTNIPKSCTGYGLIPDNCISSLSKGSIVVRCFFKSPSGYIFQTAGKTLDIRFHPRSSTRGGLQIQLDKRSVGEASVSLPSARLSPEVHHHNSHFALRPTGWSQPKGSEWSMSWPRIYHDCSFINFTASCVIHANTYATNAMPSKFQHFSSRSLHSQLSTYIPSTVKCRGRYNSHVTEEFILLAPVLHPNSPLSRY